MNNKLKNSAKRLSDANHISSIISNEQNFFVQWGSVIFILILLFILTNLIFIKYNYSVNFITDIQSINPVNNTLKILMIDENHLNITDNNLSKKSIFLLNINKKSINKIARGVIIDVKNQQGVNGFNAVATIQVPAGIIRHDSTKLITDAQIELGSKNLLQILLRNTR